MKTIKDEKVSYQGDCLVDKPVDGDFLAIVQTGPGSHPRLQAAAPLNLAKIIGDF